MNPRRFSTDNLFVLPYWQPFLTVDGDGTAGGGGSAASNGGVSNGAGGEGGAANNGAAGNGSANGGADWASFAAGLERLGDTFATKLDALRGDVSQLPDSLRPPPPAETPPDYDSMTQGELVAHMTGAFAKMLESKMNDILNPINAQLNDVRQTVATRDVTQEVARMRSDHKDFNDWKDEMVSLAKQHPTLGIQQLYGLARSDNPAKAGELDKRYNPPPPPVPRFGGLTPTALNDNGGQPPLSRAQAGQDAYREVAARHPGVLAALESM